ncbi:histidine kinase [Azorhizobium caulinodans ORS 571]|uniref:Histidine kinase n=1 Tax=Azorhizobium caulinodans (strain ATCC 43989 / DSM 5975 / JCM 20966 / LMG 6465 / NBRC 14845 / NCIMB 13405 / ORS 571) TaxID=438753 RepID=A8HSV7_AZOC5|nr:SpoIIE family protein phosphatase [Azorhizobium caulinodans]BAF90221.1 histidine kinase [Azorhizobium caulinodans ORS 571]
MLLRTRITLLVAAGFLVLLGCFGALFYMRDRMDAERLSAVVIQGQQALWRESVEVEASALDKSLDAFSASPELRAALLAGDRSAVVAGLNKLDVFSSGTPLIFEVLSEDREALLVQGTPQDRGLLDAGSMDRVLTGERITGLRQISADQILVVAARRISLPNGDNVILVLGRDARSAVTRFAGSIHAASSLLTLRGQLAAATDPNLWRQANLAISPRQALRDEIALSGRIYSVTSVPVGDITNSTVGALVSMVDNTESITYARRVRAIGITIGLGLALLGIVGLNAFLWYSFRPLERAIDVLQALSRGDTSVSLNYAGRDEIGRIAKALVSFRANVQELAETRRQRERVRRRQEMVISAELKALADAIDPQDRDQVLSLLTADTDRGEDELRRVARVLHDLSRRIVEQHTRLSSMVVELREALVTKTKLAGLQQELEIAAQVQLAILPRAFPPHPRIGVHGHMTPAREVGGDFYDYFLIDDSTLGFVVADVSGKGVPAALFMAISRTLLRSTAMFERSPAVSVRRLNDLLALENEQMLFVTLFYGVINLDTGKVSYVNAGHNLPYKITQANEVSVVPSTKGMAVAVMEGFVYEEGELYLSAGDTLFLYTDGVPEAFDIDEAPYGDERLAELLKEGAAHWPVPEMPERVLQSVRAFERGAPQADDITCLTLRYFGGNTRRHTL